MRNKQEQWAVLKRLLSYLKPYGLLTFLALAFLLATTVVKSIIPLVASHFIDQYLNNLNQLAVTVLLVYYGLYILQTIVQYVGNLLFARVSYSIVRDIRRDAFANMEKLGMSYFDKTPAGSIVSRLTNDTETISDMFSGILSSFISAVFIFVTTLYTMLVLDYRLTALVLLFLPLIFLLVNLYRKKSVKVIEKTRSLLSDINSKLAENIEGIRIIQAFNQEKRLQEEFDEINQEHLVYANRSVALDSLFLRPAMSLLKLLGYAVLMAYFGYRGLYLGITAGTMYAFIQYINRLFDPLIEVTQNFSTLQTSMVSAGRVFALSMRPTMNRSKKMVNPRFKKEIFALNMCPSLMMENTKFSMIFPLLSIKVKPLPLSDIQDRENLLSSMFSCAFMNSSQVGFS